MQITTTFRHMEPSEALKGYAEEKLRRVKKYILAGEQGGGRGQ